MSETRVQKRLNDDDREALMDAFHAWDHAHLPPDGCEGCIEFAYAFEPLIVQMRDATASASRLALELSGVSPDDDEVPQ